MNDYTSASRAREDRERKLEEPTLRRDYIERHGFFPPLLTPPPSTDLPQQKSTLDPAHD